jgi:glycerol-3-phosphate dehydrogenase
MKRDLTRMSATDHDLVIVGGGISGASIARDAALRGLSVALLDKSDFCQATTAASSKLIHGGLRYLRNLELGLVRESLRERRMWEVIAPHLVAPLPMLLPVYKRPGSPGRMTLRMGLTLYDMLAYDRNRLVDEAKKIPGHELLSKEEAIAAEPSLPPDDLVCAFRYYDCQMYSPERLCLEHLLDAAAHGAQVANYAEVTRYLVDGSSVIGVEARDRLSGETLRVRGKVTINASGPWADKLPLPVPGAARAARIVRSKGIHVIVPAITGDNAVLVDHQGSHFFLLPWRGHTLIGTTDTKFLEHPDDFAVTEADIEAFLHTINTGYPTAALRRDDVRWFYGGLRPLVETGDDEDDTYGKSRKSEVYDHARTDGVDNLLSALGGKWTTSRHLAQKVIDLVGDKLGRALPECTTDTTPLPGGHTGGWEAFVSTAAAAHPELPTATLEELVRSYGSMYEDVLALASENRTLADPLAPGCAELGAQVIHAVRQEMALHLDDVLFRRTGIGTLGDPGDAALHRAADLMGDALGWDAAQRDAELQRARARFQPAPGAGSDR